MSADDIACAQILMATMRQDEVPLNEEDESVLLDALSSSPDAEKATSDTVLADFTTIGTIDAVSFVRTYATINIFAFYTKESQVETSAW